MSNSKELLSVVVKAGDGKRAEDIVALDMQGISLLADYFVIMSANTERQVEAIVQAISEQVEEAGFDVQHIEGQKGSTWYLIDLGDVVIHVFKQEDRDFYNLEKLWSAAPRVDVSEWVTE